MIVKQKNGVAIRIVGAPEFGEILFDITKGDSTHRRAGSMRDGKFYQNLTVKEAKAIRKALKVAIKEARS